MLTFILSKEFEKSHPPLQPPPFPVNEISGKI